MNKVSVLDSLHLFMRIRCDARKALGPALPMDQLDVMAMLYTDCDDMGQVVYHDFVKRVKMSERLLRRFLVSLENEQQLKLKISQSAQDNGSMVIQLTNKGATNLENIFR